MKIKHLLHDHQNTILEMKAAGLVCSEVMHKGQDQLESELHKTLSATLVDMQELDIENIIKELELVGSTHHLLVSHEKMESSSLTPYISTSQASATNTRLVVSTET